MNRPLLHRRTLKQLDALLAKNTGSSIWYGAEGVGKTAAARWLAMQLNCLSQPDDNCRYCRQIKNGNFADLIEVNPDDKTKISISQVHQLQHQLVLGQYNPRGTRVVVLEPANELSLEAQNALLKTIEEPPANTLILLLCADPESLLPTIRSRCSLVYFAPVEQSLIAESLEASGADLASAKRTAQLSQGSPGKAFRLWQQPELLELYAEADGLAEKVLNQDLFQRLVLAGSLAKDLDLQPVFIDRLAVLVRRTARSKSNAGSTQLEAIERFLRYTKANVGLKVALEELMLEL